MNNENKYIIYHRRIVVTSANTMMTGNTVMTIYDDYYSDYSGYGDLCWLLLLCYYVFCCVDWRLFILDILVMCIAVLFSVYRYLPYSCTSPTQYKYWYGVSDLIRLFWPVVYYYGIYCIVCRRDAMWYYRLVVTIIDQ